MSNSLRIIYAGTPDFSVPALQALIESTHEVVAVYTQPDRPAGRGRELQASPVKQKAREHDIAVYQPLSLKDDVAQQELQSLRADLMVVTAYGLLLPAAVLAAPRLGCINIHASLLPRWRGAAPIQRALLAGDVKTGITIMQMDEGLDTGDMLSIAECDIEATDTGSSLHDKLMYMGADALLDVLPAIAQQSQKAVEQNDADACYATKLNKSEAKIDWSQSAHQISRAIRAYNAWPVAHCLYQRKNTTAKLRLWAAEVSCESSPESSVAAQPGEVIREVAQGDSAGIDVLTGEGVLRITELQAEGKRRMSAVDFLHANSLLGQVLK